jgi:sialidase-1
LIHAGKKLMYFSNPASPERKNMTVKLSKDDGKTWSMEAPVFSGPAAYSNLIPLPKGEIGLVFEHGAQSPYQQISFTKVNQKSFEKFEMPEAAPPPAPAPPAPVKP